MSPVCCEGRVIGVAFSKYRESRVKTHLSISYFPDAWFPPAAEQILLLGWCWLWWRHKCTKVKENATQSGVDFANIGQHSTSFNIVSKPLSRSNLPFGTGFGNCRISFRIFKRHTVQSRWVSPKAEHTFLSSFLQIGYRNFTSSCISGTHVLSLGVAQTLPQILIDKPSQKWSVSCSFYRKPIGQHRCITKHAGEQRETPPAKCKGSVWQCVGRKKVGAQGGSGDRITVWLPSHWRSPQIF